MFLFLIPAVSMRLWSDERKSGTIELLLTMPITVKEAVIAKFLASWAFIGVALAGTFPMVLTVVYLGNSDRGVVFFAFVSYFFLSVSLLVVWDVFSGLSKNPVITYIPSVCISFVLIMPGSPQRFKDLANCSRFEERR